MPIINAPLMTNIIYNVHLWRDIHDDNNVCTSLEDIATLRVLLVCSQILNGKKKGRMDGWMDGWMDGKEGRKEGRMANFTFPSFSNAVLA